MTTDTEAAPEVTNGTGKGYGCACASRDPRMCCLIRYGYNSDPDCQRCECLCHQWEDHDDDLG